MAAASLHGDVVKVVPGVGHALSPSEIAKFDRPTGQRMEAGGVLNSATSTNWSGLVGFWSGIQGAGASWTVPTVAPSGSSQYSATWVGVDGDNNTDLIQTGTSQDTSGYHAWLEILPAPETVITNDVGNPALVLPGDQITGSVAEVEPGIWTIYLNDTTQGWYFSRNYDYYGPGTSAEWIEEAPTIGGSVASLANFGTVGFTQTALYGDLGSNGTTWYGTNLTASNEIDMINSSDTVLLASPSAPTSDPSGGQDFTDTYDDTPIQNPPAAPTDVVATTHDSSVTMSWNASNTYGGPAPTSYTATVGSNTCTTAELTCTVTGLTNGQTYLTSVYATSAWGQGPSSFPTNVLVSIPPAAPTVHSVVPGGESAVVSLTAPTDDGGAPVTSYTYYWSLDGVVHDFATSASNLLTLTGLPNAATISFFATATNVSGVSPTSAAVVATLPTLASPPTGVVAIGHTTTIQVSWTPATPGAFLYGYAAYASSAPFLLTGASKCTTTKATKCTIKGLAKKTTYYVWVTSLNPVGANASVGVQTATATKAVGPPGAVTSLKVSATKTTVYLHWTAPERVGNGVSNYIVEESESGTWVQVATPTTTYLVLTGLTPKTKYSFKVLTYAVNGQMSTAVSKSVTTH